MATYDPNSQSLRVSNRTPPQTFAQNPSPFTPVHSPHHSVNSSVSSRTPIHTLSIHEYRKQQNTSSSQIVTPSGKTLRRKAAAPTLNNSRPNLSAEATRLNSQPLFRPLHVSQSAQQLHSSHRSPFQKQLLADQLGRAQSAEPRTQGGSISSISTTTSSGKVGHFKSRKRLPKPPAVTGVLSFPSHLANLKSAPHHPTLHTALDLPTRGSRSSDTRNTHTTSTISLSRFPKPPHLADPSFSPPHHESERTRLDALSYASTAPATPPATPATIHYRGASFDLVNPHDSLVLHDIVTPSKDFGSSEYLLIRTSEEPFPDFAEMAPKRALYGDLNAAHAGIMRRAEDAFSNSNLELPLPPTSAAISTGSSAYTSPSFDPESNFAPPPLAVSKAQNDSRFSLKQLTRTLTKRLGKNPEKQQQGRELQDLSNSNLSLASISMEGTFPRPLQETYVTTPQSAYFPLGPTSPITPTSPTSPQDESFIQDEDDEVEFPRRHTLQRYESEPLASLIPDGDYSTQVGRLDDQRTSWSDGNLVSKPYYDDLDSIYPSSSVYTSEDRRRSNYQDSLIGASQSNPFLRYSGVDSGSFADEYNRDSLYGYNQRSTRKPKPLSQDMFQRMAMKEKTDTISKIIDQYDPNVTTSNTVSMQSGDPATHHVQPSAESYTYDAVSSSDLQQQSRVTSGLSQFQFGIRGYDDSVEQGRAGDGFHAEQPALSRKPTIIRDAGQPPRAPAPLAPPFQYGQAPYGIPHPESSGMFSSRSDSSYGDTQNLLEIPQSGLGLSISQQLLPTSSSYSQPAANSLQPSSSYSQRAASPSPATPQEALNQADEIFQNAANKQKHEAKGIPAMWTRRGSGSLLLAKQNSSHTLENRLSSGSAVQGQRLSGGANEADWESVAGNSNGVRDSYGSAGEFGSIADYSSSESTRNSLGLNSDGSLPSWKAQDHSQGLSIYSHPSPIRDHRHPFSSSPPQLRPQGRMNGAPESSSPLPSSPPGSATVPVFRFSAHPEDVLGRGAVEQPYVHTPWADRYAFSDKETEELLASGPNDKIMVDTGRKGAYEPSYNQNHGDTRGVMPTTSSPLNVFDGPSALECKNSFEKLCVIGPKRNLTGTPRGTGMHETGSSIADTSSPYPPLSPKSARLYPGFYASPFLATSSITKIYQSPPPVEPEYERTPSQMTLFPRSTELEAVEETSPNPGAKRRESVRSSTTFQRSQNPNRLSRPAVNGQTKLRQMVLAPGSARKTLSSAGTNFSQFIQGSDRPSTSDTNTPLRPRARLSIDSVPTVRSLVAHQHSPHLLFAEKTVLPENEERCRKLSWAILAVFCIVPPMMFIYPIYGDQAIASITKGELIFCTVKSKRVAFIGGIIVNIAILIAIVVPIVITNALAAA